MLQVRCLHGDHGQGHTVSVAGAEEESCRFSGQGLGLRDSGAGFDGAWRARTVLHPVSRVITLLWVYRLLFGVIGFI